MKKPLLVLLFLPLLSPGLALGKDGKNKAPKPTPTAPTQVPLSSIYLRNSPDTDPTEYIGGFVMEPGIPDETRATKLACSAYVSYKEVSAGNTTTSDLFTASQGGALKIGVPPIASGDVGIDNGVALLVEYTATKKWQAVVADPGGFATCCATYPDQCRAQYVGDFLAGTGKIYSEVKTGGNGKVGVVANGVAGQLTVYAGRDWVFAHAFPEEVAFAFKLKDSPVSTGDSFKDPICASDWMNQVPNDQRGHWERAVSDVMPDEAGAQANGWDHAALQVAKWCGADVSTVTLGGRVDEGDGAGTESQLGSSNQWTVASNALVQKMRLVCTGLEKAEAARGYQYKQHGLYLLPQSNVTASCAAMTAALPPHAP